MMMVVATSMRMVIGCALPHRSSTSSQTNTCEHNKVAGRKGGAWCTSRKLKAPKQCLRVV